MSRLRIFVFRLRGLFLKRSLEQELADESARVPQAWGAGPRRLGDFAVRVSVEGSYDNVNDISSSSLGNLGADIRWRLEFE